jgi:hypothetical protein
MHGRVTSSILDGLVETLLLDLEQGSTKRRLGIVEAGRIRETTRNVPDTSRSRQRRRLGVMRSASLRARREGRTLD